MPAIEKMRGYSPEKNSWSSLFFHDSISFVISRDVGFFTIPYIAPGFPSMATWLSGLFLQFKKIN